MLTKIQVFWDVAPHVLISSCLNNQGLIRPNYALMMEAAGASSLLQTCSVSCASTLEDNCHSYIKLFSSLRYAGTK
jgi:hypothetical protein